MTDQAPPIPVAPAPPSSEAIDRALDVYDAVERKGASRARAVAKGETRLREAMGLVEAALRDGVPLNLTEVARRAGVSKQTVYNHLPADLIAARGLPTDPTDPDPPEDPDAHHA